MSNLKSLNSCKMEYTNFNTCLVHEKNRLRSKEEELRQLVGKLNDMTDKEAEAKVLEKVAMKN